MSYKFIEYKTAVFIKDILDKQLEKYRTILKEQKKDNN